MSAQNLDVGPDVSRTADGWSSLANRIYVPHSEEEYRQLVSLLDAPIEEVDENESHRPHPSWNRRSID